MSAQTAPKTAHSPHPRATCSACETQHRCLSSDLNPAEIDRLDGILGHGRMLRRGDTLYHAGAAFRSLYVVRTGAFKNCILGEGGQEQITAFRLPGDVMATDAISLGAHMTDAVALEDAEVCELPYPALLEMERQIPSLQRKVFRLLSSEMQRDQGLMLTLGYLRAEQRLAAFLLNLSRRRAASGRSATDLDLTMTREEIASHLGLTIETVSRTFTKLENKRLIAVRPKGVNILEAERLMELLPDRKHL